MSMSSWEVPLEVLPFGYFLDILLDHLSRLSESSTEVVLEKRCGLVWLGVRILESWFTGHSHQGFLSIISLILRL